MMKFRTRSKSSKDSRGSSNLHQQPEQYLSPASPRAVAPTPPQGSMDSRYEHRKHSFEGKHISVPVSSGDHNIYDENRQRSRSVGRSPRSQQQEPHQRSRSTARPSRSPISDSRNNNKHNTDNTSLRVIGRSDEEQRFERDEPVMRQAQRTGRSSRVEEVDLDSSDQSVGKPQRKSKMEKIRQLQAKNELYKEEFKRVQKDRKKLKRELEIKNNEIASLTKEIDLNIEETSRLKSQLSEALIKIEHGDDRHEKSLSKLSKEALQSKDDLAAALRRVTSLNEELAGMKEFVRRKDEQIESLSQEASSLQIEISSVRQQSKDLAKAGDHEKMVNDLVDENRKLQDELGATLERATAMVKDREDAISDLLKENDELKALLSEQERAETEVSHQEFEQLQMELHKVTTALEEAQDRNLLLEEEIEAWLTRGNEMEGTLDRLSSDLETWQEKARTAESSISTLEGHMIDSKADASSAREALRDAEAKHRAELEQLKLDHKAEIQEIQEKAFAERIEKPSIESPQALLLQQAVADRIKKSTPTTSWRKFLKAADEEESLDDNQKRIKELELRNAEQEEEIKALRSDLVRLRSSYNEVAYTNKKRIDQLTEENEAYSQKVKSLEGMLRLDET